MIPRLALALFVNDEPISVQRSDVDNTSFHEHNFLEIAYISKGSAIHYLKNTCLTVHEGDYFVIDYNESHKFSKDLNNHTGFEVINILFKPEFIDASLKDCRGFADLVTNASINCSYFNLQTVPTSLIYHDDTGELRQLFLKMLREYTEKDPKHQELLRCYLTEIIILTLRKTHKSVSDMVKSDKKLNDLLQYINRNYMNDIRLKDISSEMGYTQSYLSSIFTKSLGISFSKYLQNIRIAQACNQLTTTDKSVDEISEECGYNDIKFFRKLFKEKLKMSPTEFRKMSRNQPIL